MAPERKVLPLRRFPMTWQEMLSVSAACRFSAAFPRKPMKLDAMIMWNRAGSPARRIKMEETNGLWSFQFVKCAGRWDSYCEWQRLNAVSRNRRQESAKWGSRGTQELARSSA